jgi:uncharacterized protein YjbJ (UPF0337 family)
MRKEDIRGKVKEAAGRVTDDEALERQGQKDQVRGDLKQAEDKVKDAAQKAKDAVGR